MCWTPLSPEAKAYFRFILSPKPSYCCQRCGECIGWMGRFFDFLGLFPHKCQALKKLAAMLSPANRRKFLALFGKAAA